MADEQLSAFNLVGGTALALQAGHRISVDIDLFTT
ncbi:MAG: nucleotidyl transferase AbiEii/AbiGii toxin family protein [Flavisolibacter sp.]